MRNMLIAAAAAALTAAAFPAMAREAGQGDTPDARSTQQQRSRADDAGERRICVNERLSDSRMRRRICRTAREWQDLQANDER